ncbi:MAG: hypothetical protein QXP36_00040 [Conexivisphaerales archaeon]
MDIANLDEIIATIDMLDEKEVFSILSDTLSKVGGGFAVTYIDVNKKLQSIIFRNIQDADEVIQTFRGINGIPVLVYDRYILDLNNTDINTLKQMFKETASMHLEWIKKIQEGEVEI